MRPTNPTPDRVARLALLALWLGTLAACAARTGPPVPDKYLGTFDQGGYLLFRWREGLDVMIWYGLGSEAGHSAHSAGFTEGRLYTEQGSVRAADGQALSWQLQTADGQTGDLRLGTAHYDLAQGNLFIVSSHAGTMEVRQLSRDLSPVPLDEDGILSFAADDPDLSALLSGTSGLEPAATPTRASGLQLQAALEASPRLPPGEPVHVEFTLTNRAQAGLHVLKWYTPLEGIRGEIFRVVRDGQPIPYEGPLVSRGAPSPEEYVYLEAGASVSATVDVAEVYDFSQPGVYTITYQSPRISHVARDKVGMATSVDDLHPVEMPSNPVEIVIDSP